MRAVVYRGAKDVRIEEVENPRLESPTDVIVKVSSAAICGSDLHMYEGRTDVEEGKVFGHEIMGVVDQTGDAVQLLERGDRVVLPFNIACGTCFNCTRGFTNACLFMSEEGSAGAAYGYANMGPYRGGQAEYVRVPFADFNALKLPGKPHDKHEDDFLMLADILPTAYHAAMLAKVDTGHSVAIYGGGPVGLLSVLCARLKGAADVYLVDPVPSRLDKARELGAIPINPMDGDPVELIRKVRAASALRGALRPGEEALLQGVLSSIDAVGYQAHDLGDVTDEQHSQVLEQLISLTLPTGALGIIGVYVPNDPGGSDKQEKEGVYPLPFGLLWSKGLSLGTGQAPIKQYNTYLRDVIIAGQAAPGTIVSHHIGIDQAPEMYERFDRREEGVTKVVITFT